MSFNDQAPPRRLPQHGQSDWSPGFYVSPLVIVQKPRVEKHDKGGVGMQKVSTILRLAREAISIAQAIAGVLEVARHSSIKPGLTDPNPLCGNQRGRSHAGTSELLGHSPSLRCQWQRPLRTVLGRLNPVSRTPGRRLPSILGAEAALRPTNRAGWRWHWCSGADATVPVMSLFAVIKNSAGQSVFEAANIFGCEIEGWKQRLLIRNSKLELLISPLELGMLKGQYPVPKRSKGAALSKAATTVAKVEGSGPLRVSQIQGGT
ncbi:hypothetical protein F5883DRAFT_635003 [Diaporthe sp. PMI_573]|nr:hypothetical protein F5883DRAFT_635003 [Diaporthaceae sp. PMI_573]